MTLFEQQLLVTFGGILLSGFFSTVIAHRLTTKRAEKEFRRAKLELLFMSVHRYAKIVHGMANVYLLKIQGHNISETMSEIFDEIKDKEDSETAYMLCNLYFHELADDYAKIQSGKEGIFDLGFSVYTGQVQATAIHERMMEDEIAKFNAAWATFNDKLFKVMNRI